MKRFHLIDPNLFKYGWAYVLQSLMGTVSIFLVLTLMCMQDAVVIASLGATVFIIFAMPQSVTANFRNVVGGHFIGILSGVLWAMCPHDHVLLTAAVYAAAVGTSMLLMVVFDCEHPPAAGTALGKALEGFSFSSDLVLMSGIIVLALIHALARRKLKTLV